MPDRPWPPAIDDLLETSHAAVDVLGPDRWSVGARQVVRFDADHPEASIASHRRLLAGLAGAAPFAVPTPIGDHGPWLVIEIPSGVPADRPDRHPEPGTLATRAGEALAALHALSIDLAIDPAGDRADRGTEDTTDRDPWAPIVARCQRAVAAGLVDSVDLPSPYDRYQPEELLDLLVAGVAAAGPPPDGPVLCHGRPELGRVLVDGDRLVGFDGLETAVVADRHLDLATAHLSVAEVLGAEAVYGFYEGYGTDPDLARLDRAMLAHHLLTGRRPIPSPAPSRDPG